VTSDDRVRVDVALLQQRYRNGGVGGEQRDGAEAEGAKRQWAEPIKRELAQGLDE
jgi:hypothetical protein